MRSLLLAVFVGAAVSSAAHAGVTDVSVSSDTNIYCPYTFYSSSSLVDLGDTSSPLNQYAAAQLQMDVTADGDPTLTLQNTINNDTAGPWTGYIVDVTMNQYFTISGLSVSNPGWTITLVQSPQVGGPFTGEIDLDMGTGSAIQVGQDLDFSYQVTFNGGATISETLTPVPEPGSFSLLAAGATLLGLAWKRRK